MKNACTVNLYILMIVAELINIFAKVQLINGVDVDILEEFQLITVHLCNEVCLFLMRA